MKITEMPLAILCRFFCVRFTWEINIPLHYSTVKMKALGWWLIAVGTLRLASVWFGFFDIWALRLAVFSKTTSKYIIIINYILSFSFSFSFSFLEYFTSIMDGSSHISMVGIVCRVGWFLFQLLLNWIDFRDRSNVCTMRKRNLLHPKYG